MRHIVVPLDGSALADRALMYAVPIARARGGALRLIRACELAPPFLLDSGSAVRVAVALHAADLHDAEIAIAEQVRDLRRAGVDVDGVVRSGGVSDVILEGAGTGDADLLVMTTHGRGGLGRFIHGSVADEVLRRAEVPILLVPEATPPAPPTTERRRILVALDGSELAEASLGPAIDLARASGADLALLRVIDAPNGPGKYAFIRSERGRARRYLQRVARRAPLSGIQVSTHVRVGPIVSTILATAAAMEVDAVAVGTHGRGGFSRLVMGSVSSGLVEHATLPLLIVSARAAAARSRSGALDVFKAQLASGSSGRPVRLLERHGSGNR